jgi:hypothetical protein
LHLIGRQPKGSFFHGRIFRPNGTKWDQVEIGWPQQDASTHHSHLTEYAGELGAGQPGRRRLVLSGRENALGIDPKPLQ